MKSFYIGNGFYIHSGYLKRLVRTCHVLGIYKGLKEFICGHLGMYLHSSHLCDVKHKIIEEHLRVICPLKSDDIVGVCEVITARKQLEPKERIWFYWAQGTESMPEVVRMCYNYLVFNNTIDGREVILLTSKNVDDFIKFPSYIEKTLSEGRMTLTQYSELLRMALLYEYGGMWLDSTIFVPRQIDSHCFVTKYWTHKSSNYNWYNIVKGRWSLSIWNADNSHEDLYKLVLAGLLMYWKREKYLIDYMWLDYFLDIVYNDFPEVRKDIDAVDNNNPDTNTFFKYAKEEYMESRYNEILKSTNFFKLTYKLSIPKIVNGKETIYGFVLRNMPVLS